MTTPSQEARRTHKVLDALQKNPPRQRKSLEGQAGQTARQNTPEWKTFFNYLHSWIVGSTGARLKGHYDRHLARPFPAILPIVDIGT